jgi:hypothetical protein
MNDHYEHLVDGNVVPETCAECSALLDRLVKNALRWQAKSLDRMACV